VTQAFLGFVLLWNFSFQQSFDRSSTTHHQIPGGFKPFTDTFLNNSDLHPNLLRMQAALLFGTLNNFSIWDHPSLSPAPVSDCPMGEDTCISHFLQQKLDLQDIDLPQTPGYIKLASVPIYQIFLTPYDSIGHEHQYGLYGWDEARLRICGRTYLENQRDSVVLGKATYLQSFETWAHSGKAASFCAASALHLPDEEGREDQGNCHFYPTVSINVWEHYADVIYQFPERGVYAIENISDSRPVDPVPLETYFKLYDILFPTFSADVDPDGLDTYLFVAAGLAGKNKLRPRQLEVYLLPWLMQQPMSENSLAAVYCKRVYRIQLALESFWVFTILSLVSLAWCLWRVVEIYSKPKPSSLSKVNFPENDTMIVSGLTGVGMKDLSLLQKIRLRVVEASSEEVEMN
jgi:hypothetical protein